jgi:hypothetical protein
MEAGKVCELISFATAMSSCRNIIQLLATGSLAMASYSESTVLPRDLPPSFLRAAILHYKLFNYIYPITLDSKGINDTGRQFCNRAPLIMFHRPS